MEIAVHINYDDTSSAIVAPLVGQFDENLSFREGAHLFLDEWLDAMEEEKNQQDKQSDTASIFENAYLLFNVYYPKN